MILWWNLIFKNAFMAGRLLASYKRVCMLTILIDSIVQTCKSAKIIYMIPWEIKKKLKGQLDAVSSFVYETITTLHA